MLGGHRAGPKELIRFLAEARILLDVPGRRYRKVAKVANFFPIPPTAEFERMFSI